MVGSQWLDTLDSSHSCRRMSRLLFSCQNVVRHVIDWFTVKTNAIHFINWYISFKFTNQNARYVVSCCMCDELGSVHSQIWCNHLHATFVLYKQIKWCIQVPEEQGINWNKCEKLLKLGANYCARYSNDIKIRLSNYSSSMSYVIRHL